MSGPSSSARDVAQIGGLAVGAVLDDDVPELLLGLQPALRIDDVLKLRSGKRRLSADLARCDLHVLFAHCRQYFIDIHAARGDLARIQPQAHGVVAGTEYAHIAHARNARQHILDLNHRVVAQIQRVVAAVGRLQEHHHGQVGRALLRDQTDLPAPRRASRVSACATRFWVCTCAMSRSVPSLKVTVMEKVPSGVAVELV